MHGLQIACGFNGIVRNREMGGNWQAVSQSIEREMNSVGHWIAHGDLFHRC